MLTRLCHTQYYIKLESSYILSLKKINSNWITDKIQLSINQLASPIQSQKKGGGGFNPDATQN